MTYNHSFVSTNSVTMHYVTAGDPNAIPLVLLHGYPQTWYCWKEVIPRLVEAGYFCIAPDLRGLGDTTKPASGYDKKTIATDVHELLERLGVESFFLAGHDWGGAVAFSLAAHFPASVRRLAVIDVAIPGDGQANIGQGGRRWHHTFLQTPDLPEALITGNEEVWIRWFYENYGAHPGVIDENAVHEYIRTYAKPGALRAGFGYYRAVAQDIADNEKLEPLTVPTLAVGGGVGFGRGAEVEQSLRRMAKDVEGLVLDNCGHWVPEEKPAELTAALIGFFGAH
ncbi:MAG: alpha/beta hydrolase [Rhodococcus sp. (in: high G+C Gram-positive bacteria)]